MGYRWTTMPMDLDAGDPISPGSPAVTEHPVARLEGRDSRGARQGCWRRSEHHGTGLMRPALGPGGVAPSHLLLGKASLCAELDASHRSHLRMGEARPRTIQPTLPSIQLTRSRVCAELRAGRRSPNDPARVPRFDTSPPRSSVAGWWLWNHGPYPQHRRASPAGSAPCARSPRGCSASTTWSSIP